MYQIPKLRSLFGDPPPQWIRDAIGKDFGDDWPGDDAMPKPDWVEAAEQLMLDSALPADSMLSKMSPTQHAGFILGILNSVCRFFSGDLPISPAAVEHLQSAEVEKALEDWMRLMKIPKARLEANARQINRFINEANGVTQRVLAPSQKRPHAESQDFLRGYTDGSEVLNADLFHPGSTTQTQKTLALLTTLWPLFNKFPSVAAIHATLAQAKAIPGDLKSFQKITGSIGLRLRPRGRPRRQNKPPT